MFSVFSIVLILVQGFLKSLQFTVVVEGLQMEHLKHVFKYTRLKKHKDQTEQ